MDSETEYEYYPNVYHLPKNNDILDHNNNVEKSIYQSQPLFKYGFHWYIHQTKNKMEIFNNDLKHRRNKHSTNLFEHLVPDYNEDINSNIPYLIELYNDYHKLNLE